MARGITTIHLNPLHARKSKAKSYWDMERLSQVGELSNVKMIRFEDILLYIGSWMQIIIVHRTLADQNLLMSGETQLWSDMMSGKKLL